MKIRSERQIIDTWIFKTSKEVGDFIPDVWKIYGDLNKVTMEYEEEQRVFVVKLFYNQ